MAEIITKRCEHLEVPTPEGAMFHGHIVRIGNMEHQLCKRCYETLMVVLSLGGEEKRDKPLVEPWRVGVSRILYEPNSTGGYYPPQHNID